MRTILILFLTAGFAFCGPIGIGFTAGVPATGVVMSSSQAGGRFGATGGGFVIGPTVEIRLPFGLGVEGDALYRAINRGPYGSNWEFPILVRYRLPLRKRFSPFVVGGASFDRNNVLQYYSIGPPQTTTGPVIGAGLETRLWRTRISPEVRYTHWTGDFGNFAFGANLINRNQIDFLFGVVF